MSDPASFSTRARAHGRSLTDFGEISAAERALLHSCRRGEVAVVATGRPEQETAENRVRAGFVRFLALGGDQEAPIHERGVTLRGAWLSGVLDLEWARVEHHLGLWDCRIEQIKARYARLKFLNLNGSILLRGLAGAGLHCDGGIFLRNGFHATGPVQLMGATINGNLEGGAGRFTCPAGAALNCEGAKISGDVGLADGCRTAGSVRFLGAAIGGDLICDGGGFENPNGIALHCDRVEISGDMSLCKGFHAAGEVRLLGATVGGSLICREGRFDGGTKTALTLGGAVISGSVFLHNGFHATGAVRLHGSTIGGNLECSRGRFENSEGIALSCDSARVGRGLLFRALEGIVGGVDLSGMRAGGLGDDIASWGGARGKLVLNGFTYDQLIGPAPTDPRIRLAWLHHQRRDHLGSEFRPQPWEQLIAVLRAMGHPDEARAIAVAKQTRLRRAGKVVRGARILHWFYGFLVGYGYRPLRLLIAIAAVWLLCATAYKAAVNPGWFGATTYLIGPTNPEPDPICVAAQARARGTELCPPAPPDYRSFEALVYSADVLLPVVDLGYASEWQAVVASSEGRLLLWGRLLRYLYWFEIVFGWVAGLLLVAVLRNLIKKD